MITKNKPSIAGPEKKMRSDSTSGSSAPLHRKSQNEHGWFWTMMHKSLRHH